MLGFPIVARPDNCVVYCMGCAKACPEEAITFPEKETVVELVKRLRVQYNVQQNPGRGATPRPRVTARTVHQG